MAHKQVVQHVITCDFYKLDKSHPRGVFRCNKQHVSERGQSDARLGAKLGGWYVCPYSASQTDQLVDLCPEHRKEKGL